MNSNVKRNYVMEMAWLCDKCVSTTGSSDIKKSQLDTSKKSVHVDRLPQNHRIYWDRCNSKLGLWRGRPNMVVVVLKMSPSLGRFWRSPEDAPTNKLIVFSVLRDGRIRNPNRRGFLRSVSCVVPRPCHFYALGRMTVTISGLDRDRVLSLTWASSFLEDCSMPRNLR